MVSGVGSLLPSIPCQHWDYGNAEKCSQIRQFLLLCPGVRDRTGKWGRWSPPM